MTAKTHFGKQVFVARKGAVAAGLAVSASSRAVWLHARTSCEVSAIRTASCAAAMARARSMWRTDTRQRFTVADHEAATKGIQCRKDAEVIHRTPAACKPIDAVMAAQNDLVEVVHTLHQVVCVKG